MRYSVWLTCIRRGVSVVLLGAGCAVLWMLIGVQPLSQQEEAWYHAELLHDVEWEPCAARDAERSVILRARVHVARKGYILLGGRMALVSTAQVARADGTEIAVVAHWEHNCGGKRHTQEVMWSERDAQKGCWRAATIDVSEPCEATVSLCIKQAAIAEELMVRPTPSFYTQTQRMAEWMRGNWVIAVAGCVPVFFMAVWLIIPFRRQTAALVLRVIVAAGILAVFLALPLLTEIEVERETLQFSGGTNEVRVPASLTGELQIVCLGPLKLISNTQYRLSVIGRYPQTQNRPALIVDVSDWDKYDPSEAEMRISFSEADGARQKDSTEFNSGASAGRSPFVRLMSRCDMPIEIEQITLARLQAQSIHVRNVWVAVLAIKKHWLTIGFVSAVAIALWWCGRRGREIVGVVVALVIMCALGAAEPQWLTHSRRAHQILPSDEARRFQGQFMHEVPLGLEPQTEYWLQGEYRQMGASTGDGHAWVIDLVNQNSDRDEHEVHLGLQTITGRFPTPWKKFAKTLNSRELQTATLRFMGTVAKGIEVRNMTMYRLPSAYGWLLRWRGLVLLLLGVYAAAMMMRVMARTPHLKVWLMAWYCKKRWAWYLLLVVVYVMGGGVLLAGMWVRGGRMPQLLEVYHVLVVPLISWLALYVAGWPCARWICGARHGHASEVVLAPVAGALLFALTVSLSAYGVGTAVSVMIVVVIALVAWLWYGIRGIRPQAPDSVSVVVIVCGFVVMWFTLLPVSQHTRTAPFTNTNADLGIYAPATQWLCGHTLKELRKLALRKEEPPYVAYLAYRYRETPLPLELGTYTMYAGLAALTRTAAYSCYPMSGAMSVAMITLAVAGVLRITRLAGKNAAGWCAVAVATHFLCVFLFWESFTSSIMGIMLVLPGGLLGLCAFRYRAWRWAVAAGVVFGAVLVTYVSVLPLIACIVGLGGGWCLMEQLMRRRWRRALRMPWYAVIMLAITTLVAPSYVGGYVKDLLNPRGFNRSICSNTSGGDNYPERSLVLMAGISETRSAYVPVPPKIYRVLGLAATWGGVALGAWFAVAMARRVARLPYSVLIVSAAGLVAGTYFLVPNRYMYFKAMGFVTPVFSVLAASGWLTAHQYYQSRMIRRCLWMWLLLIVLLRLDAITSMPRHLMPQRYMGDQIQSVESAAAIMGDEKSIIVEFGDVYYSPHVMAMLHECNVMTTKPFGYIWWQYKVAQPHYTLRDAPWEGGVPVWSNMTYFLYARLPHLTQIPLATETTH